MHKKLFLLVWLLPLISYCGENALQLRCIPSPNLLKNVQFRKIDSGGRPESWVFDNCSKSPYFKSRFFQDSGADVLEIYTPWQKFGYYLQKVAVQEGVCALPFRNIISPLGQTIFAGFLRIFIESHVGTPRLNDHGTMIPILKIKVK